MSSIMNQTTSKLYQIRKNTSFRAIMNHGQKWITPGFIIFKAPCTHLQELHKGEGQDIFKGIVASKKVGNAVKRNRAKRRLREIMRLSLLENEYQEFNIQGHAIVLIARQKVFDMPFEKLKSDLKWALKKLNKPKTESL